MGTIRDRKGKVLIEEEKIKKRWKEYTEKLYKKKLNDLDNHDGLVTHPEPDFLECEVKWALGHTAVNKVNGGDGIPAELFKILKRVPLNMSANLENLTVVTELEKINPHPSSKKSSIKEYSNHQTVALIFHACKVILKILHAKLQHCMNWERPDIQAGFIFFRHIFKVSLFKNT